MKLITEVNQHVELLQEEVEGVKKYHITGIFMQAECPNRNGRIYPLHILSTEVNRFMAECVMQNRALGELSHPDGPSVNLDRVSHMITDLRMDGSDVIGKAKIMNTPNGKIVKSFIDEGVKLGVSSRGLGSLRPRGDLMEVQSDFWLSTIDIVADPSAPEAFVNGIMEGKEWVWDNGLIKEAEIQKMKKTIEKATRYNLDEQKISVYHDFLKKLTKV